MIRSFRITRKSCVFRTFRSRQSASSFSPAIPTDSGEAVAHVQLCSFLVRLMVGAGMADAKATQTITIAGKRMRIPSIAITAEVGVLLRAEQKPFWPRRALGQAPPIPRGLGGYSRRSV